MGFAENGSPNLPDLFNENNPQPDRAAEIRNMAGHGGDLLNALDAAPDTTGIDIAIPSNSTSTKKKRGPKPGVTSQPQANVVPIRSQKEIEDLAKRDAAIKKIQSKMAEDVAAIPYDVWAYIAQDDTKALTQEEEKELSDAYALVAESLPSGVLSPLWTCILFLLSRNGRIIRKRIKQSPELTEIIEEGKTATTKKQPKFGIPGLP